MESPKYSNVFVNLGAFHIGMAFFSAIGKYIAESGGPQLLNQSRILEKGSLKGFVTGKSYNHCRIIHQILPAAMEILHFREFDSRFNNESLSVINEELKFIKEEKKIDFKCFSKEATEVLDGYLLFSRDTLEGKYGLTAQYWMGYIEMLHLYHEFSRSTRTRDLDLYFHCLPKTTNYFFAFNHRNYAKWLVLFHDNLLKLKITHPEVHKEFKNGCFSLKRTKNLFQDCQ